MITIGIESTAHTFGVAIIKNGEIVSNSKKSFTTQEGGMIPAQVMEHHFEIFDQIFKESIQKAEIKPHEIDLIAFSNSPGIGHTLRIGATFARSLAIELKKPIIGVNHCIAHLEIGRHLTGAKDPILLYASGANTQIIAYEAKKYRIFGETLDIGIGNFLDNLGRAMGLGFPAGPIIDKLASQGKKMINLPYSVKGMDIALGGMLTNLKQKIQSKKYTNEDIAHSTIETSFAMLVEISERALAHTNKTELVIGGGVGCSKRLQEMCQKMCEERGAKFYSVPNQYLVDNAGMIAVAGEMAYNGEKNKTKFNIKNSQINPYLRTDEVEIKYRD